MSELQLFIKQLGQEEKLTPQQKRTLRGQAIAGNLEAAKKGLQRIKTRESHEWHEIRITSDGTVTRAAMVVNGNIVKSGEARFGMKDGSALALARMFKKKERKND